MKTFKGYCVRIYNYSDDNHYNIISTEDSYYRDQYEAWDYKQQCLDYLTEEELALTDSDMFGFYIEVEDDVNFSSSRELEEFILNNKVEIYETF